MKYSTIQLFMLMKLVIWILNSVGWESKQIRFYFLLRLVSSMLKKPRTNIMVSLVLLALKISNKTSKTLFSQAQLDCLAYTSRSLGYVCPPKSSSDPDQSIFSSRWWYLPHGWQRFACRGVCVSVLYSNCSSRYCSEPNINRR